MTTTRSGVSGAAEVAAGLSELAADLGQLGVAMAESARVSARAHAPSTAQLERAVSTGSRATVNYSGITTPAGFTRAVDADITSRATADLEQALTAAIQKAGLA